MNTRSDAPITLAVAAGKGGTGKTLVATSLAQAMNRRFPGRVEILDCDVEEPNVHILLNPAIEVEQPVEIRVPEVDLDRCVRCGRCAQVCENSAIAVIRQAILTYPELCSGCGSCAFVCPRGAITETPRRVGTVYLGATPEGIRFAGGEVDVGNQKATPVTKAVKGQVSPDRISIIDAPPGTACPMQETVEESDFCLLVTEPTPFGLSDLGAAVETCRSLGVSCGVLINRAGSGFEGVEKYCEAEGLPVLLKIPQDRAIAEAYSCGETLLSAQPQWEAPLAALFETINTLCMKEETTHA